MKATRITEKYSYEDFRNHYGPKALPLFTVSQGRMAVNTVDKPLKPLPGHTLVALVEDPSPSPDAG